MVKNVTNNRNLVSPNAFKVTFSQFPNVEIFTQALTIPNVSIGTSIMPTNTEFDFSVPSNKLVYEDLILTFIVDENLEAFYEIYNNFLKVVKASSNEELFSDITIDILSNQKNKNKKIIFKNAFIYNITGFQLDYRQSEDLTTTCDISIKYSHFTLQ